MGFMAGQLLYVLLELYKNCSSAINFFYYITNKYKLYFNY
ncbi:hypothetical protein JOC54_000974 [Alkalihalobacillus xiaoxiensis]|uniref:Uncharacterized protein n=1 Tax=Shouchella xiaoxiensis TaxID=766895 RepID=A0ABS2SQE8_9BACI|nr:hypothetical protein [Shouchella xiaoxiensis]